jgi:type I restriction enzyme S subunit
VTSLFDFCNPKQWPTIPQTAFVGQGYPVYGANGKIGHYTEFNHAKPTVLITCRGATCGTINVCEPKSYVTGNAMALDDLDESRVSAEYLVYALRNGSLAQAISGTAQPQITRQSLTAISIPLPPLAEQRRIAEVLDRAEALRAKRRAALAQLDSLTQSLFLDLFGDVATNDRRWPSERMEDLIKIRRGGSPRPIENYLGGDINWIKIGDGTQGSDIYLERCADKITKNGLKKTVFLKAGSLIFANCGVSLGFARILKIDGCIHDGWLSFEQIPEFKLDKLFLLKALNSITEHFRRIAPAGTQPNLNTSLMKNFRIVLPPITLQREFARRLVSVEKVKTAQRASLAELDALFASLQHRAFRGEL